MGRQSEGASKPADDADLEHKRRLLREAIEERGQDLMNSIRVWVRRFGLAGDRASVEAMSREVLHQTVVVALQASEVYDDSRPPLPWLRGVAFNAVRRRRRDESYGRRISPVSDVPLIKRLSQRPEFEPLPEEEMFDLLIRPEERAGHPDRPSVDELLSLVGEEDSRLLRLAEVEDLTGKEIAAELGIREGAAYTRLSRARKRLREAYHESNEPGLG